MKLIKAVLFLFFSFAIVAIGAQELHRHHRAEERTQAAAGDAATLIRKLHDPSAAMRAAPNPAVFGREASVAEDRERDAYDGELGRSEQKSWLEDVLNRVMP